MRVAFRLCKSGYPAASGEGAKRFGGRWNPVGVPAVYAAQSRALCILERLVHLARLPHDEAFTKIHIPTGIAAATLRPSQLPAGWDNSVEIRQTQTMGADLLRQSAVVRVPSVVVPGEWCFVFNPEHPDFASIRFDTPVAFQYDRRLRPAPSHP